MPNGGLACCGHCCNLENGLCALRNEAIILPFWTTCNNMNDAYNKPEGVIYAIVSERNNGPVSYAHIPYYNGLRADTFYDDSTGNNVLWESKDGQKLRFDNVDDYLTFYKTELNKKRKLIVGAIIGDVIGSVYEWMNIKTTDFNLFGPRSNFTDDSVLTLATMDGILNGKDFTAVYQEYGRKYPGRGYGGFFRSWVHDDDPKPYNSYGNGSAMRVSPVGWAFNTLDEVLFQAKRSAEVTHNHPEGIKGAKAVAAAVFLSRSNKNKDEIKNFLVDTFNYNLDRKIEEIRPIYQFNESCQGSVPEAVIAFLESTDFEDSIRLAISIGGDSDTIACITGGIAEAFYKDIPQYIIDNSLRVLPTQLIRLVEHFSVKYRDKI